MKVMNEKKFKRYLKYLRKSVKEVRKKENYNDNLVSWFIVGYVRQNTKYAFTGEQIKRIFDLVKEEKDTQNEK